jgi:hypothetical protein
MPSKTQKCAKVHHPTHPHHALWLRLETSKIDRTLLVRGEVDVDIHELLHFLD